MRRKPFHIFIRAPLLISANYSKMLPRTASVMPSTEYCNLLICMLDNAHIKMPALKGVIAKFCCKV